MALEFYNTLTRRKEEFKPLEEGKVRMYTCGPTVYNYPHIGNYRAYIFEDQLKRYLEYRGYEVKQVMNLTDVDDKTIRGAREEGVSLAELTDRYKRAFFEDIVALNIEPAEVYPAATDHIDEMVELIRRLRDKGYTYEAGGSIYYRIAKFKNYGKLSHMRTDGLKAGARIDADEYGKELAHDFALWKAWAGEGGDVFWDTELGKGRPGWHIECSAMSMKYLGEHFDIHMGGVDNIFPHHENEIAQSEAATGKPFVNYWLHCEHLLVENRKMSKSLGNFYTLRDLLEQGHDPKAIRYLLLSTHYRQRLNFTFEGLEAAKGAIRRLSNFVDNLKAVGDGQDNPKVGDLVSQARFWFQEAMDDDLNISRALAAIFDFVKDMNKLLSERAVSKGDAWQAERAMADFDKVLGVLEREEEPIDDEIVRMVEERDKARKEKNWKVADGIRSRLREMGIVLEDTPNGTRWKRGERPPLIPEGRENLSNNP